MLLGTLLLGAQTKQDAVLFSSDAELDESYLLADGVTVTFDGSDILVNGYYLDDLADGAVTADFRHAYTLTANQDPNATGNFYSTFYTSDGAYRVPDDAQAYIGAVDGDMLKMTNAGDIIRKAEAVILKAGQSSITLMPSANKESASAANVLTGTDVATTLGANDYALSYSSSNGVGFYHWSGKSIGANKAYLSLGGAHAPLRSLGFMFDDGTVTGVPSAYEREESGQSYNLQGIEVDENQHGVVIRNGKKYYYE